MSTLTPAPLAAPLDPTQALLDCALRQEKQTKKILLNQRIRSVCAIVLTCALLSLAGKVVATMRDVQMLASNASYSVTKVLDIVQKLELKNTMTGIDTLVNESSKLIADSSTRIESSLNAIASLDVTSLNNSIKALESVSTAIGRLFGYKPQ